MGYTHFAGVDAEALKINGVAVTSENISVAGVTSSAAELNELDGATVTYQEINLLDDQPASATLTPAAGASNVSSVTIQAKDAVGVNMARSVFMLVWLSDAATGVGKTTHGTVTIAAGAKGADFGILTANYALLVQTDAAGAYILTITDAHKTGYYVCAKFLNGSAPSISAALQAADYGA